MTLMHLSMNTFATFSASGRYSVSSGTAYQHNRTTALLATKREVVTGVCTLGLIDLATTQASTPVWSPSVYSTLPGCVSWRMCSEFQCQYLSSVAGLRSGPLCLSGSTMNSSHYLEATCIGTSLVHCCLVVDPFLHPLQGALARGSFGTSSEGGLFGLLPVAQPEPVLFPRRSLYLQFAVLLLRAGYDAADSLDFIPMVRETDPALSMDGSIVSCSSLRV